MDNYLLLVFLSGMFLLLALIILLKVNAFISLLISSIAIGLLAGMPFDDILKNISEGMGGTLGFVAVVVGLGAIFGAILDHSGATHKLSDYMLSKFGIKHAPAALSISGFLIAIPVFFDVAFIILVPMLYALQKKTGKSLLYFALPLLCGLAVTHAFIPPTPGPIAVADMINAELGWVIFFGFIIGIPTTIVAGLMYGTLIAKKIFITVPEEMQIELKQETKNFDPNIGTIIGIILLPLLLILLSTVLGSYYDKNETTFWINMIHFIGHPFTALIISVLLASYLLGIRYGATKTELQELSIKALAPAGLIILITGAGGVFKQMLIETGVGIMLADQITQYPIAPFFMAFLIAQLIRLLQGSATVAMITAAGLVAPILNEVLLSPQQLALVVLSIAAGASGFSHVNDSGFWLVNRYLGLTEAQTLKSWTMMMGILAITALIIISLINMML
jgi:Gnt-I system low-affinity gluconate transporter